jgi:hypothetical protein
VDSGHELMEEKGKLKMKLYIKAYGPLTFIFKNFIKKNATKGLKTAAEKLIGLARK